MKHCVFKTARRIPGCTVKNNAVCTTTRKYKVPFKSKINCDVLSLEIVLRQHAESRLWVDTKSLIVTSLTYKTFTQELPLLSIFDGYH